MKPRVTVRVRMEDSQGKTAAELLQDAKQAFPTAYAVRPLASGDLDILVPDQATKDRITTLPDRAGCKVLRQDYQLEVPGVLYSTFPQTVDRKLDAGTAQIVQDANRRRIAGLVISKARWLHDPEAQAKRNKGERKLRGTLILSTPTQGIQRQGI
jgi:hypothetical protein